MNPGGPCLAAALSYARRGLAVFPCYEIGADGRCTCGAADCDSPGKHPRTVNGLKAATCDQAAIRAWWERWPAANVAISTDGLCVIDLDVHRGLDGSTALAEIEEERGRLPDAPEVLTPSGGRHLYFRENGVRIGNSAGRIAPGIDVRGRGGYVLAPPSNHIAGRPYTWELAHALEDADEVPTIPAWFSALVAVPTSSPGSRPRLDVGAVLDGVPDGQRGDTLFRLACKLRRADVPEAVALSLVLDAAARSAPPYPESRVREMVPRAYRTYAPAPPAARDDEAGAETIELRTLDLGAALSGEPAPVPWLLTGWLARRDLAMLAGDPKTGKSWLALSLTFCAATGRPWLGVLPIAGGPLRVLYVDEEQNPSLVSYRVRRLASGLGLSAGDVAALPIRYLSENGLSFDRTAHRDAVFATCRDFRPDLVILDSLVRFHARDENSSTAVAGLYAATIKPLAAEFGAAVLALHHMTKPHRDASPDLVYRVRGSGDLVAAQDQLWSLERGDGGRLTLRHERSRWADTAAPLDISIADTEDGSGVTVTAGTIANAAETAILGALKDAGTAGVLRGDLVAALEAAGFKAASKLATKHLGRLNADGRVRKETEGRAVRYWLSALAPKRLTDDDQGTD